MLQWADLKFKVHLHPTQLYYKDHFLINAIQHTNTTALYIALNALILSKRNIH